MAQLWFRLVYAKLLLRWPGLVLNAIYWLAGFLDLWQSQLAPKSQRSWRLYEFAHAYLPGWELTTWIVIGFGVALFVGFELSFRKHRALARRIVLVRLGERGRGLHSRLRDLQNERAESSVWIEVVYEIQQWVAATYEQLRSEDVRLAAKFGTADEFKQEIGGEPTIKSVQLATRTRMQRLNAIEPRIDTSDPFRPKPWDTFV